MEIFAKSSVGHHRGQVAMGGGDHTHIDLQRLGQADGVDLARLERAQQATLHEQCQ